MIAFGVKHYLVQTRPWNTLVMVALIGAFYFFVHVIDISVVNFCVRLKFSYFPRKYVWFAIVNITVRQSWFPKTSYNFLSLMCMKIKIICNNILLPVFYKYSYKSSSDKHVWQYNICIQVWISVLSTGMCYSISINVMINGSVYVWHHWRLFWSKPKTTKYHVLWRSSFVIM